MDTQSATVNDALAYRSLDSVSRHGIAIVVNVSRTHGWVMVLDELEQQLDGRSLAELRIWLADPMTTHLSRRCKEIRKWNWHGRNCQSNHNGRIRCYTNSPSTQPPMLDVPLREPDEIRRDCVLKLRSVEVSGMFSAILACLLGEDWSTPRIEELRLTPDRCLLVEGGEMPEKIRQKATTRFASPGLPGTKSRRAEKAAQMYRKTRFRQLTFGRPRYFDAEFPEIEPLRGLSVAPPL